MLLTEALSLHEIPLSSSVTFDLIELLFFPIMQSANVVTDFTRKQLNVVLSCF